MVLNKRQAEEVKQELSKLLRSVDRGDNWNPLTQLEEEALIRRHGLAIEKIVNDDSYFLGATDTPLDMNEELALLLDNAQVFMGFNGVWFVKYRGKTFEVTVNGFLK